LLQMDDFDQFLEQNLRRMLDPVALSPALPRKAAWLARGIVAVPAPTDVSQEVTPFVEPLPPTVPVPARQV
jgi:hypothetical protein